MRLAALLFAVALAAAPTTVLAKSSAAAGASVRETQDREIVRKAWNSGSLAAARTYQADLVAVLDHAPKSYPLVERDGDRMLIRSNEPQAALAASLMAAAAHDKSGAKGKLDILNDFNTYGTAAFLLGSLAMEARDPAGAIVYLDRGLTLQPDNLMLVTEKGTALVLMRRHAEALALYESAERLNGMATVIDPLGEARLLRAKGFVLIELNRMKEAEAAYVAALKLEPDHAGAKGELQYIRKLADGARPTEMKLVTGDKAKDGDAAPAKP